MGARSRAHAGGVDRTRTRAPAVGRGNGVDRVRAAASSGRAIRMARETALLRGPGNALRRKRRSNAARAARSPRGRSWAGRRDAEPAAAMGRLYRFHQRAVSVEHQPPRAAGTVFRGDSSGDQISPAGDCAGDSSGDLNPRTRKNTDSIGIAHLVFPAGVIRRAAGRAELIRANLRCLGIGTDQRRLAVQETISRAVQFGGELAHAWLEALGAAVFDGIPVAIEADPFEKRKFIFVADVDFSTRPADDEFLDRLGQIVIDPKEIGRG